MSSLSQRLRAAARPVGILLSVLALAAFALLIARIVTVEDVRTIVGQHWPILLTTLFLYGLAYVPMTAAWIVLARGGGAHADAVTLSRILLTSQIGKYLPGNVAHFVGRAYLGRSSGISLAICGVAMGLELAGILVACSILAGIAALMGAAPSAGLLPYAAGLAGVAALAASAFVMHNRGFGARFARPFLFAVACYCLVLALLAGANVMLVGAFTGDWSWPMAGAVSGAFVVSWLAGFVTPGSPAGLGVREVAFFSLLAGLYPDSTILLVAAGFRLVTAFGDLLAWLVGLGLYGRRPAKVRALS